MEPTYQERLEAIPWNVHDVPPELSRVGEIIQEIMGNFYPYEAFLNTLACDFMTDCGEDEENDLNNDTRAL